MNRKSPDFDQGADLSRIAQLAAAWRSLYRPAKVTYTPQHLSAQIDDLAKADSLRLYLVTRPATPVCLALLAPFPVEELLELLALAPLAGPDLTSPFRGGPGQRKAAMEQAPELPSGRGVYCFLLGDPAGAAWLDLPAEGLVILMARWGGLNRIDPEPFLAQRMRLLGEAIGDLEGE